MPGYKIVVTYYNNKGINKCDSRISIYDTFETINEIKEFIAYLIYTYLIDDFKISETEDDDYIKDLEKHKDDYSYMNEMRKAHLKCINGHYLIEYYITNN